MVKSRRFQASFGVCLNEKSGLPRNFSWLEESKIAGSARPESEAEMKVLREQGVKAIISLTGTPLNPKVVKRLGFDFLHSHISGAPTTEQLLEIIRFVEKEKSDSRPVLVHCGEGKGRTGTVLAAYLVYRGLAADDAIQRVREKRPGSIESPEQENSVREFEESLRQFKK